ncbi:MAG: GNAT family N-acetyltransferase [Actinomycetota bacterium]|nr:GNAT family N-acetyltransferase [Actinomycetota bacterium]
MGRFLYVDDFVTRGTERRRGHGAALFRWHVAEARRLDCDEVHLDSGVHRHDAHRFYLARGMRISGTTS